MDDNLKQNGGKINRVAFGSGLVEDLLIVTVILLVGVGGFGLGRLSVSNGNKSPIRIINSTSTDLVSEMSGGSGGAPSDIPPSIKASNASTDHSNTSVVASKSGTKYHYLWCSGAQRISEQNKIVFDNKGLAERAGYTLASNCNP